MASNTLKQLSSDKIDKQDGELGVLIVYTV